jgi:hypothetical protein
MIFRVRYKVLGGHTHCALFAAKQSNMTWAKCGDFTVRNDEFDDLQLVMSGVVFSRDQESGGQKVGNAESVFESLRYWQKKAGQMEDMLNDAADALEISGNTFLAESCRRAAASPIQGAGHG